MNNLVENSIGCIGCSACAQICPQKAIKIELNKKGFARPHLNELKCIHCHRCERVCPMNSTILHEPKLFYGAKNKKDNIRIESSSGGISDAICSWAFRNGGVVYGVRFDEHNKVITQRAGTYEECIPFRGSKYVQADINEIFLQIEGDLKKEILVVFFGTSCRVNGLLNYLELKKVNTEKLVTVDFICHGVPSPIIFADYINYLNRKKRLKSYRFRSKYGGWGDGSITFSPLIEYSSGKIEIDTYKARLFLELFFRDLCLNDVCYVCPYAYGKRTADITLADFWGMKASIPSYFDPLGVSLVIFQNVKKKYILDELNIDYIKVDAKVALSKQKNMFKPTEKNKKSDEFWMDYFHRGFMYVARKYAHYTIAGKIWWMIKKYLYKVQRYE